MLSDPAAGLGVEPAGPRPEPADAVGPLIRGIAVIRALTEAGGALGLPELSRETDLARSSVDRIIGTLGAFGYVRFQRREVALTPRLMELGNAYLRSVRIPALLGPLAAQLSEHLDEVVTLTVTDDAGAFLVHEAVRPRKLAIVCHVGDHLPLDRCAGGALYASGWDDEHWQQFEADHSCTQEHGDTRLCAQELRRRAKQARERGWALDDQWLEPGLVAIGIPVHGPDGTAACEVNVLSFTSRHADAAQLADTVMPALHETVRQMEDALRTAPRTSLQLSTDSARQVPADAGIESLARGLTMLTAFSESRPDMSIADAARVTGLPRASARRALITLEHLGYLSQTRGRYRPNATVLSLGYPVLTRLTLGQIATPHLETLSDRVGHSASLAVLHDDTEIMYVARAATATRLMTVDIHVGTRLPAYATAMGRVLLAALPDDQRAKALRAARPERLTPRTTTDTRELLDLLRRIHEGGFAAVDEELEAGLRSIAVPITGHDGRTIGALNVAMHAAPHSTQNSTDAVLPAMRAAADALHRDLTTIGPFHRIAPM
jgi:IclR family pca regulon transcriptional regulator